MTDTAHDLSLNHLPPASAALAGALRQPKLIAIACVVALSAAGWVYIGLLVGNMAAPANLGGADWLVQALTTALCRPGFGSAANAWPLAPLDLALVLSMWCAMALAMMLPSAGPMLVTYAEIADTAARKGEPVVSPMLLAAGYLAVWIGFAVAASAVQAGLTAAGLLGPTMAPASPLLAGAIFLCAGFYQFSRLKDACLAACQRPFPFLFANWTTRRGGIFRLGLRQGLHCLGCCWAMMLLMLAVGVMNVIWMAALGAVATAEKMAATTRPRKAIGGVLAAIGIAFIITSVAAHWPVRAG